MTLEEVELAEHRDQYAAECAFKRTAEGIAQLYGATGLAALTALNAYEGHRIGVGFALIGLGAGYACWRSMVAGSAGWSSAFTLLGISSAAVSAGMYLVQ